MDRGDDACSSGRFCVLCSVDSEAQNVWEETKTRNCDQTCGGCVLLSLRKRVVTNKIREGTKAL